MRCRRGSFPYARIHQGRRSTSPTDPPKHESPRRSAGLGKRARRACASPSRVYPRPGDSQARWGSTPPPAPQRPDAGHPDPWDPTAQHRRQSRRLVTLERMFLPALSGDLPAVADDEQETPVPRQQPGNAVSPPSPTTGAPRGRPPGPLSCRGADDQRPERLRSRKRSRFSAETFTAHIFPRALSQVAPSRTKPSSPPGDRPFRVCSPNGCRLATGARSREHRGRRA